jgi:hypothetical protein
MWKPDLLLYNSANEAFDATFPTNVIVKSDGSVSQIPPGQQLSFFFYFLFLCTLFNTASSAAPEILRVGGGCWDRTAELLRLWH